MEDVSMETIPPFWRPEKQKDKEVFSYIWCFFFLFYKSVKTFPLHWGWSKKEALREATFQILLRVRSNFPKLWVKIELLERKKWFTLYSCPHDPGNFINVAQEISQPTSRQTVKGAALLKYLEKKARKDLSDPPESQVIKLGLLGASKGIILSSSSKILSPGPPTTHCWYTVL